MVVVDLSRPIFTRRWTSGFSGTVRIAYNGIEHPGSIAGIASSAAFSDVVEMSFSAGQNA